MEDNFSYKKLKATPPSDIAGGSFAYGRSSLKEESPPGGAWFDTPWFDDWFGADENFKYERVN